MPLKYSKKVLEHFTRPHNQGSMKKADAVVTVGNPKCGDLMRFYLRVGKNSKGQEIVDDLKFETLGCGAAIATSSMATDLAKGKTLDEALKISKDQIANELGGLPKIKMHCSMLADEALRKAIGEYRKSKNK